MNPFRLLVTGSRDFPLPAIVGATLTQVATPFLTQGQAIVVVHGSCPHRRQPVRWSVDALAGEWARTFGSVLVSEDPHPADWDRYGRSAGFRRNMEMVALGADLCLAFIAHGSSGSTHCADAAERARIPVVRIRVDGLTSFLSPVAGTVDSPSQGGPHHGRAGKEPRHPQRI